MKFKMMDGIGAGSSTLILNFFTINFLHDLTKLLISGLLAFGFQYLLKRYELSKISKHGNEKSNKGGSA